MAKNSTTKKTMEKAKSTAKAGRVVKTQAFKSQAVVQAKAKKVARKASGNWKAAAIRFEQTNAQAAPWRRAISPEQIVAIRRQLDLTQDQFAERLFATSKTLKNWEQGLAKPNAQAAVLMQLIGRHPQLLEDAANAERLDRVERQKSVGSRLMAKYSGALAELAK